MGRYSALQQAVKRNCYPVQALITTIDTAAKVANKTEMRPKHMLGAQGERHMLGARGNQRTAFENSYYVNLQCNA